MIENVLAKDINGLEPRLTELQSELLAAGIPQGTGQPGLKATEVPVVAFSIDEEGLRGIDD